MDRRVVVLHVTVTLEELEEAAERIERYVELVKQGVGHKEALARVKRSKRGS